MHKKWNAVRTKTWKHDAYVHSEKSHIYAALVLRTPTHVTWYQRGQLISRCRRFLRAGGSALSQAWQTSCRRSASSGGSTSSLQSSALVGAWALPMSPTAADASIGSASGAATTSMSAVLGRLHPAVLSGRFRLLRRSCARFSTLRCTPLFRPIACFASQILGLSIDLRSQSADSLALH